MLEKAIKKHPGRYITFQALLQVYKKGGTRLGVDRKGEAVLCTEVRRAELEQKARSCHYSSHAFFNARPKLPE
jgi:hypothetical protein